MRVAWVLFRGFHNLSRPGIYGIECIKTGEWYIGSCNRTMQVRHNEHDDALSRGIHHNSRLQRAWNKYGSRAFRFHALQYSSNRNLLPLETQWIIKKNPAYNVCWPGGQVLIRRDRTGKIIPIKRTKKPAAVGGSWDGLIGFLSITLGVAIGLLLLRG